MSADDPAPNAGHEAFLRRWSRRKHDATQAARAAQGTAPGPDLDAGAPPASAGPVPVASAARPPVAGSGHAARAQADGDRDSGRIASPAARHASVAGAPIATGVDQTLPASAQGATLPPVESLHFESDFTAFLDARVEESVKRAALKRLFQDPRFNVMDGLDVYIDDYSKFETLSPAEARGLTHARAVFDAPRFELDAAAGAEPARPSPETITAAGADPAHVNPRPIAAAGADPAELNARPIADAEADSAESIAAVAPDDGTTPLDAAPVPPAATSEPASRSHRPAADSTGTT